MVRVGITLQPERRYLDLLHDVVEHDADYVEVAPETLWRTGEDGALEPNAYHDEFLAFRRRTGKPFVAHGVGLSLGTVDPSDDARLARWLARIEQDHAAFEFLWYTDHLGSTVLDGRVITLPIAPLMTGAVAVAVANRLAALQRIVPDVGFENSVFYFLLGDWLDEPAFFRSVLRGPRMHLLLDLHNVFTMAVNLGVDPEDYLARVDLDRVIEIHLAGGERSDPAWLPDGKTLRLDSHDHAVPEEVWELFDGVVSRCPNLRGVTIERMEGTVEEHDVEALRAELMRAREAIGRRVLAAPPVARPQGELPSSGVDPLEVERLLARALTAAEPGTVLSRAAAWVPQLGTVDPDGLRIATLLIQKLRFERLVQGSSAAGEWFERDAREFTAAFRRYHVAVPPTAGDPRAEARTFDDWLAADMQ